jgi:hypothetical protein
VFGGGQRGCQLISCVANPCEHVRVGFLAFTFGQVIGRFPTGAQNHLQKFPALGISFGSLWCAACIVRQRTVVLLTPHCGALDFLRWETLVEKIEIVYQGW